VASIRPTEATSCLVPLTQSDDPEIAEAASEAISMAELETSGWSNEDLE